MRPTNIYAMNRPALLLVLVLPLVFPGCLGQKTIVQQYYILEAGVYDSNDSVRPSPLPLRCLVQATEVDKAYAGTRIASRVQSNEIAYFQNHQWAARPEYYFTQIITDFFDNQGVFLETTGRILVGRPDVLLSTRIHNVEMVVSQRAVSARLNLEFQLTDASSGMVVVQHKSDRTKSMEDRSMNQFANMIGEMLSEELTALMVLIRGADWPERK